MIGEAARISHAETLCNTNLLRLAMCGWPCAVRNNRHRPTNRPDHESYCAETGRTKFNEPEFGTDSTDECQVSRQNLKKMVPKGIIRREN